MLNSCLQTRIPRLKLVEPWRASGSEFRNRSSENNDCESFSVVWSVCSTTALTLFEMSKMRGTTVGVKAFDDALILNSAVNVESLPLSLYST